MEESYTVTYIGVKVRNEFKMFFYFGEPFDNPDRRFNIFKDMCSDKECMMKIFLIEFVYQNINRISVVNIFDKDDDGLH